MLLSPAQVSRISELIDMSDTYYQSSWSWSLTLQTLAELKIAIKCQKTRSYEIPIQLIRYGDSGGIEKSTHKVAFCIYYQEN